MAVRTQNAQRGKVWACDDDITSQRGGNAWGPGDGGEWLMEVMEVMEVDGGDGGGLLTEGCVDMLYSERFTGTLGVL